MFELDYSLQCESYRPVIPIRDQLELTNGLAEPLPCKYINNTIYTDQPPFH